MVDEVDWTLEENWLATRRPVGEASNMPAEAYTTESFYRLEQERIYRTSWVCIGTTDDVESAGDAIVRSIGGRRVIVFRNEMGELRCFANSCRHRGTELLVEDCTIGPVIRCPYHRWSYDWDGQLIAAPRFEEVEVQGFDLSDFALHPVRLEQFGCLLFATGGSGLPPVYEWFGDLGDRLADYELANWRTRDSVVVDVQANWKLVAENFQEYYHLSVVHPELAKVSRVADHYRYQGPGMYCGQTTTPITNDDRGDWMAMPPVSGLGKSDSVSGRFLSLFPNVLLSLLPNHLFLIRLEPLRAGLTREHCSWLVPPENNGVAKQVFDATRAFWVEINDEDIAIVESNQRGLSDGGYIPGRLSPRFEEPLHRFHNMVVDQLTGVVRIPSGDPSDEVALFGSGVNPLPWRPVDGASIPPGSNIVD